MAEHRDDNALPRNAAYASPSALTLALRSYADARHASLIEARQVLGVNELDARALLFIANHPGSRPTSLREYLGITSAGVTALVDRLENRGAVRREVDPDDRRVSRLTATVDLSAEPWSALTRFDTNLERALAGADAADTERLAALVVALTDAAAG